MLDIYITLIVLAALILMNRYLRDKLEKRVERLERILKIKEKDND